MLKDKSSITRSASREDKLMTDEFGVGPLGDALVAIGEGSEEDREFLVATKIGGS